MTSPAFAHSCLLPLPSTGVDPKESETSCVLNSTSVLLPQPETAHGSQTARILLVPLSVTLPTENPLSPPTVTEALQAPRRLHRLCPTSTLTSSPPTHPRITQLQPHRPLQSPGEENGNPLQYSCLENPMDRGAWWGTVHGVAKSWIRLSNFHSHIQILGNLMDCTPPGSSVHGIL